MILRVARIFDRLPSNLGADRDVHNERIKLIAGALNAIGLASLIGGVVSPIVGLGAVRTVLSALAGVGFWVAFSLAAFKTLGYIRPRE